MVSLGPASGSSLFGALHPLLLRGPDRATPGQAQVRHTRRPLATRAAGGSSLPGPLALARPSAPCPVLSVCLSWVPWWLSWYLSRQHMLHAPGRAGLGDRKMTETQSVLQEDPVSCVPGSTDRTQGFASFDWNNYIFVLSSPSPKSAFPSRMMEARCSGVRARSPVRAPRHTQAPLCLSATAGGDRRCCLRPTGHDSGQRHHCAWLSNRVV